MIKKEHDHEILYIFHTLVDIDVFADVVDLEKNARIFVKFYDAYFEWHGFVAWIPFADLAPEKKDGALHTILEEVRVGCEKIVQQHGNPLLYAELTSV